MLMLPCQCNIVVCAILEDRSYVPDYITPSRKIICVHATFILNFITIVYFLSVQRYPNSAEYFAISDFAKYPIQPFWIFWVIASFWGKLYVPHTTITFLKYRVNKTGGRKKRAYTIWANKRQMMWDMWDPSVTFLELYFRYLFLLIIC